MNLESAQELKATAMAGITRAYAGSSDNNDLTSESEYDGITYDNEQRIITNQTSIPRPVPEVGIGIKKASKDNYHLIVAVKNPRIVGYSSHLKYLKTLGSEVEFETFGRVEAATALPYPGAKSAILRIGSSIGHHRGNAGRITCFVRTKESPSSDPAIFSCNHVLAYMNSFGKTDDIVIQPGREDEGVRGRDTVGRTNSVVKLHYSPYYGREHTYYKLNDMDAATASIDKTQQIDPVKLTSAKKVERTCF